MYWAYLLVYQITWIPATLAAYHERSATWFLLKSTKDAPHALFGFSVTYEPTSKRLIASAPREDKIGQVYSCDIGSGNCSRVQRENVELSNINFWFGAVVKAGLSYFVTCMPLQQETLDEKTLKLIGRGPISRKGSISHCYRYNNSESLPDRLATISPEDRVIHTNKLFEQSIDSFGWSIDVSGNDILMGGPAMFTGRTAKYSYSNKQPVSLTGFTNDVEYNFGYSVLFGQFWSNDPTFMYAVGSPYGKYGYGKVSFYTMNNEYFGDLRKNDDEGVIGSMFGAVLCAGRFTRGSYSTALLVGAPTYAAKDMYNVGAVYVYLTRKYKDLPAIKRTIRHNKDGSYFGSAIVSVGDLDGDGGDEIAIAAPYEEHGSGAVYLYSSAEILSDKTYLQFRPMQRIVAGLSIGKGSFFGYSLTALQDYDENGCNELAIGAPKSNRVMLLRCMASVRVRMYVNIPNLRIVKGVTNPNRNAKFFKFESCLEVIYPNKPQFPRAEMQVEVQIDHFDAKLANPKGNVYSVKVNRKSAEQKSLSFCRSIEVETPENGNYDFPIRYKINATQPIQPHDQSKFDPTHVAVSHLSDLTTSGSIWIANCSNSKSCAPDLKYRDTLLSVDLPYVIGSTTAVNVSILVYNKGEVAYDPCVRVTIHGSPVLQPPTDCKREGVMDLMCAPKTVLSTDGIWTIQAIELDTTSLTNKNINITIGISVYNHCTKGEEKVLPINVTIPLIADPSGFFIKGSVDSGKDDMVNMTRSEIALGKSFEHVYTISNSGPTNWVNIKAKIIMQKRPFIVNSTVTLRNDKDDSVWPTNCRNVSENALEATYICHIDRLFTDDGVTRITISMTAISTEPDAIFQNNLNTVYTDLSISLNGTIKNNRVTSILHLKEAVVELWIIIVASLFGLLLLLILLLILRECGFLRRENKDKLKLVRESVRRQTIQRRTMLEGMRVPSGPDSEILLEADVEVLKASTSAPKRDKRIKI